VRELYLEFRSGNQGRKEKKSKLIQTDPLPFVYTYTAFTQILISMDVSKSQKFFPGVMQTLDQPVQGDLTENLRRRLENRTGRFGH